MDQADEAEDEEASNSQSMTIHSWFLVNYDDPRPDNFLSKVVVTNTIWGDLVSLEVEWRAMLLPTSTNTTGNTSTYTQEVQMRLIIKHNVD